MIRIENDGPRVCATNYWSSEPAALGLECLSFNAGAVRLLVPHGWPDLDSPRVIRASVQLVGAQLVGVGHIVLEDGTDSPACLTLDARQIDRTPPADDLGRETALLVYGPGEGTGVALLRELPAVIERAEERPR